jgi:hypothetical protein
MQPIRWEKGEILDVPGRKCYMGCVYPWGSSFSGVDISYVVTIEAFGAWHVTKHVTQAAAHVDSSDGSFSPSLLFSLSA